MARRATTCGGECVVDFTVADAQGGEGPGQVTIDVLGYPQAPTSITTAAYTGTSVTLAVALGPATQAHPAVNAVKLYEGGAPATADCQIAGPNTYRCVVGGLVNGEKHTYTARAVNSVGESLDTTPVTSWAYQAPVITSLSASTVYDAVRTNAGQGVVAVTVDGADDIDHFIVENNGATIARTGASSQGNTTIPVGNQIITVTPVSKFQPPTSGDNRGASATVAVVVEGSAYYSGGASAPENGTTVTIASPPLQANYSTLPLARGVDGVDGGNTHVHDDGHRGRRRERRRRRDIRRRRRSTASPPTRPITSPCAERMALARRSPLLVTSSRGCRPHRRRGRSRSR